MIPAVRLFVGGHASRIQGEAQDLTGDRCFTAAHPAQRVTFPTGQTITGLLDSGAFTDVGKPRLTPDAALARQLGWETHASMKWGFPWQARYLASYDELIDEMWLPGQGKVKRRWSVREADRAVRVTIDAAAYLAHQRAALAPRTLVLGLQGVDPVQYSECCAGVLAHARPGDWIGLGGWCILGRWQSWLPVFWATLHLCLPQIARAGVRDVHIYGMTWLPALGGLLWLADQYGLRVSADSSRPILNCTWKDPKKAGVKAPYWRDNVRWWVDTLATLRNSPYYSPPPTGQRVRQLTLLEEVA